MIHFLIDGQSNFPSGLVKGSHRMSFVIAHFRNTLPRSATYSINELGSCFLFQLYRGKLRGMKEDLNKAVCFDWYLRKRQRVKQQN